jgi:hypothetical protein
VQADLQGMHMPQQMPDGTFYFRGSPVQILALNCCSTNSEIKQPLLQQVQPWAAAFSTQPIQMMMTLLLVDPSFVLWA